MTVGQLVGRERSRLRLALIVKGVGIATAIGLALVAASTIALGNARWITRPSAPLTAWVVVIGRPRDADLALVARGTPPVLAVARSRPPSSGSASSAVGLSAGRWKSTRQARWGNWPRSGSRPSSRAAERPLAPAMQGRATRWSIVAALIAIGVPGDGWRRARRRSRRVACNATPREGVERRPAAAARHPRSADSRIARRRSAAEHLGARASRVDAARARDGPPVERADPSRRAGYSDRRSRTGRRGSRRRRDRRTRSERHRDRSRHRPPVPRRRRDPGDVPRVPAPRAGGARGW